MDSLGVSMNRWKARGSGSVDSIASVVCACVGMSSPRRRRLGELMAGPQRSLPSSALPGNS